MSAHLLAIRVNACVYAPPMPGNPGQPKKLGWEEPQHWAFRAPDYAGALGHNPVWSPLFGAGDVPPNLAGPGPHKPAVALSWTMPEGWGVPAGGKEDGPLPLLPDRWVIVRMLRQTHDGGKWADRAPEVKTFVIDAGSESTAGAPIVVETRPGGAADGATAARRVGAASAGLVFPAPGTPRALTLRGAPASDDLTFAAYLPAHANVLGFIDTLDIPEAQLRNAALSYAVIGWYSAAANDPLAAGGEAAAVRAALRLLDNDPPTPADAALGRRSLFHGMVAYVDYFNPASYLGPETGAPHPEGRQPRHPCAFTKLPHRIDVGFGSSVEAALAEMVAGLPLVGAAGLPHVARLLTAVLDGSIALRTGRGGEEACAQAQRASQFHAVPAGVRWHVGPAEKDGARGTAIPQSLAAPLAELNTRQAEFNRLNWAEHVAADWLLTARIAARKDDDEDDENRKKAAKLIAAEHVRLVEAVAAAAKLLETAKGALDAALVAANTAQPAGGGTKWACEKSEDAPFQVPRDPAIALNNIDARLPARRVPRAGRRSAAMAARAPAPMLAPVDPGWSDTLATDPDLREGLRQLLDEATRAEAAVAGLVRESSTIPAFTASSNQASWHDRNIAVIARLGGAGIRPDNAGADAKTPSMALPGSPGVPLGDLCSFWSEQPWSPVFLDWRTVMEDKPSHVMTGRTVLAHRPLRALAEKLARVDAMPALTEIEGSTINDMRKLLGLRVVGQALSGFHQQLMRRNDGLPRRLSGESDETRVLNSLLASSLLAPVDTRAMVAFRQRREGRVRIEALRVVDLFGQALMIDTRRIQAAGGEKEWLPLADRVLEPLRLDVAISGLSGWLVPSRTDRAVAVYDGAGRPMMLLDAAGRRHAVPGAPEPDATLAGVLAALADGPAVVRFLEQCDAALPHTLLDKAIGTAGTAALLGRPLAVIRARIGLQRRGPPTLDPTAVTSDAKAAKLIGNGLKVPAQLGPPVRATLGSAKLADDGLVCAQLWSGGRAGPFATGAKVAGAAALTIELAMPGEQDADPVEVTLVMDPRGKFNVDVPILPMRDIAIDGALYEDALERLPAMLHVSHLLLPSHASLRAALGPEAGRPVLDLPVPARSRKSAAAGPAAMADAWLGVANHALLPVRPEPPGAAVEPGEAASLAGILVL